MSDILPPTLDEYIALLIHQGPIVAQDAAAAGV